MTVLQRLRRTRTEEPEPTEIAEETAAAALDSPPAIETAIFEIPEHDALGPVLLDAGGPVEVAGLQLDSPAITQLRETGVELVVPLISQGELIGTLNLGHRLSDQPYSTDDRRLLANLAAQMAPAIRVAQLVREQEEEAQERERIEQELRVAALIQQTLLPKQLPSISGWEIDAFYRPAREVGGDFYDFIGLDDGRLGLVIGDVTDKGVPAALVMATCRSMLRAAAPRNPDPGAVLAEVNDALYEEIPPNMFVTCLYGILDPSNGEIIYANAGHNLPYVRTEAGVVELRATGMPLGLMPGSDYEVKTDEISPDEAMLLSSDGIVEAHDPEGEMYGFPRLMGKVATGGDDLIGTLVADLDGFTAEDAEQEDDVTLVAVRRTSSAEHSAAVFAGNGKRRTLVEFSVASENGNEREAMERVGRAVGELGLSDERLQRLQTAVSEATMNAIEHGNRNQPELSVDVKVVADDSSVIVSVTDHGGGRDIPEAETPDLDAKLAGEQAPRGWGLFLIENMVDQLRTTSDEQHHTIELVMNLEGGM